MLTLAHPTRGVTTGRRPSAVRRLVDWLLAPGVAELETRVLADIGASQALRAQAELRAAWRDGAGPERWRSL